MKFFTRLLAGIKRHKPAKYRIKKYVPSDKDFCTRYYPQFRDFICWYYFTEEYDQHPGYDSLGRVWFRHEEDARKYIDNFKYHNGKEKNEIIKY